MGAATASYQIEGAVTEDGRGESIWDRFSHTPGMIENGDTGDVACDHYHRWREDLDLMQEVGLKAYRFSVAWPRIFPEGGGTLNQRGLDFYARLVDELLERDIAPVVTLYHWDLPQASRPGLGGWTARETAERFADYAATVFGALGDRVPQWVTLNEPWVAAFMGYQTGHHAPGHADLRKAVRASHHMLLGHARAVQVYRSLGLRAGSGSRSISRWPRRTATRTRTRRRARRRILEPLVPRSLFRARYRRTSRPVRRPRRGPRRRAGSRGPCGDRGPLDFLGMNFYMRRWYRAVPDGLGFTERLAREGDDTTEMGWGIVPDAMGEQLARLRADYPPIPLYITENGMADREGVGADGQVHDDRRIDYLRRHFAVAEEALAAGTDLRGYFVWSFMDNFEWGLGYRPRFGIVHVDYETLARTPKDSALVAGVIRTNGADLG